jgi:acid phosphatase
LWRAEIGVPKTPVRFLLRLALPSSKMRSVLVLALAVEAVLAASSTAVRPTSSLIEPSLSQIIATQATATALSPVSNVKGAGFDRFVQIWLENTV